MDQINKVDQLDANLIDDQSKMLLKSSLLQAFPTTIVTKYSHEITLLIDYLFFRFTVATSSSKFETQTPGNKLQNMRFAFKSKRQVMALFLLQVFIPYCFERLNDIVLR
jgi:hypothetical protein